MIDLSSKSGNMRLSAWLFATVALIFSAFFTSCSDNKTPWGDIEMPDDPAEVEKLLVGTWSQAGYNTLVLHSDGSLEYMGKVTYTDDKGESTTKVETVKGKWSFIRDYLNVEVYDRVGKLHKYTPRFRVSEQKLYMTYELSDDDAWVEFNRVVTPDEDDSESAQKKLLIGDWAWAEGKNTLILTNNGDFQARMRIESTDQGGGIGGSVFHNGAYNVEGDYISFKIPDSGVDKKYRFKVTADKLYLTDEITPTTNPSDKPVYIHEFNRMNEILLVGEWQGKTKVINPISGELLSCESSLTFYEHLKYKQITKMPASLDQGGGIGEGSIIDEGTYHTVGEYIVFSGSLVERRFKVTENKLYLSDKFPVWGIPATLPAFTEEFYRVD